MPYNRQYSQNEVHEILCASERRTRPTGGPNLGHPITQHGDGRLNIMDKRYQSVILLHETIEKTRSSSPIPNGMLAPSKPVRDDSRFLSRLDLIRAVCRALNSPAGQRELAKLASQPTVSIEVPLDRSLGIRAEAAGHATAKVGSGHHKTIVEAQGPSSLRLGIALGVFVLVDRVRPGDPTCAIHIHTAYPTEVG
jgi:hypothetical protein